MTSEAFDGYVAGQAEAVRRLSDEGDLAVLDARRPVVLTGIGTSLHACRIAAAWTRMLSGGRVRAHAVDAHDLALSEEITSQDQIVVVSHRGTKQRPNEVLARAAAAGARTVAISGEGALPEAETVIPTVPQEKASTHTISYLASLTVLARLIRGMLGTDAEPLRHALTTVPDALLRTLELPLNQAAVDALVENHPAPAFIAGTGLDQITAQEAALKLKEGTYRWVEGLHTEFALHGTPAVYSDRTTAYLLRPANEDGGRTEELAALLDRIGATVLFAGERGSDATLTFEPVPLHVRPFVTILPFQRLVSAAAAARGASPDLTHMEAEPWYTAMRELQL
ncbi:glucosamine--fructose-6-phosphate aminotransferase (isomerizing) [Actinopolyspora xinjiangensis]|uniref:Glutamine--fructose-6-phosphate aminotransferase [isomerizing] n=1 Tax=Actinopolyspora xinjiangensis TaxID=405564 RepID=A0A1H0QSH5_9ACTN|nr:SIS domain-containing protein [Actinopolyspora xinjiangensis]SDP20311.1 glucosamine--fructose-6-phosphate aminotransferase (isomerizing) [Actinopolyspora xinjiangensis]